MPKNARSLCRWRWWSNSISWLPHPRLSGPSFFMARSSLNQNSVERSGERRVPCSCTNSCEDFWLSRGRVEQLFPRGRDRLRDVPRAPLGSEFGQPPCPGVAPNLSTRYCVLQPTAHINTYRQAVACPRSAQKRAIYRSFRSLQWQRWCHRLAQQHSKNSRSCSNAINGRVLHTRALLAARILIILKVKHGSIFNPAGRLS